MFITSKLRELLGHKSTIKLPLSGAIITPNLIQFRLTAMEKQRLNICTHNSTSICDDLYRTRKTECLCTHISGQEGAMKLKFAPQCSSEDALPDGILFGQSQNFQILAKNHGL